MDKLYFKEFNTVKFCGRTYQDFFNSFFQKNSLVNKLEEIHIDYVEEEPNIIESIENCPKLKCFIIDRFDQIELLIELLRTLSSLKSLFLIDISFEGRLELNENETKEIYELFPFLSIVIKKKIISKMEIWNKNKKI